MLCFNLTSPVRGTQVQSINPSGLIKSIMNKYIKLTRFDHLKDILPLTG